MITNDQAEKALLYLAESEQEYARYRALRETEKERLKIVHASLAMDSTESSQSAKSLDSYSNNSYIEALAQYHEAIEAYYLIEAKRKRAEITVEVWRTEEASRRRGNV